MAKIVIITGSTGNLGTAVVNKFADTGYKVIGTVRADTPSNNANVIYKPLNALDSTAAKTFVNFVLEEYGRIDALVCLIGGFGMASIGSTSKDEIDKMINLNFYSAFNLVQPEGQRTSRHC